jgi:hypothetical protein
MKNRILITMIFLITAFTGCTTSGPELNQTAMNSNENISKETPQGTSASEINILEEQVEANVNHVALTSSDGIYRIESFGVNKSITSGGLYPAEGIRLVDTATEQVPWLTTPGYYNHSFLWSPDNRYVGINFETRISGGTFIVDTHNMSEIALPNVQELRQNWDAETAVHETRPDPDFHIVKWLNDAQVSVSFQWSGLEDKVYSGTYVYDVVEGKLLDIIMDGLEHSN